MNVGDTIEIDTGSAVETRKIASRRDGGRQQHDAVATAARRSGDHDPRRLDQRAVHRRRRRRAWRRRQPASRSARRSPSAMAPLIPPSRRPWKSMRWSRSPRSASRARKPAWRRRTAKAGDTNIRVRNAANISVGDKIKLDIDSVGHGIETVTVKSVGTASGGPRRRTRRSGHGPRTGGSAEVQPLGQHPLQRPGNGDQLPAGDGLRPLSNEPIQPLGTGITLDSPWPTTTRSTRLCVTPRSRPRATRERRRPTSGSAAPPSPTPAAWCCVTPPAWLLTASTTAASSTHGPPRVTRPPPERGRAAAACRRPPRAGAAAASADRASAAGGPNRSAGRFPDGADTDSNCTDFHVQTATTLAAASAAGANNIKVASVADFAAGQTIYH